jgi:hypothetical protein
LTQALVFFNTTEPPFDNPKRRQEAGYNPENPLRITLRYIAAGVDQKNAVVAVMSMQKAVTLRKRINSA